MEEQQLKELGTGALAFVGDAIYSLLVREKLAEVNRPSGELHRLSVHYVRAGAQARVAAALAGQLTEQEQAVFKRGRNLHTGSTPKNATEAEYHAATGLETLFGYLRLSGNDARVRQLFEAAWQLLSGEEF